MKILWMCLMLVLPSVAMAAYQDPVITSNDGKQMVFEFTGNAGEPTKSVTYIVQSGTTKKAVREWVKDTIDELDGIRSASSLPDFQTGQTLTRLNRTATVRAARDLWREKLSWYLFAKDSGIAAAASDLAAMKADLEATYQAGFLAP